MKKAIIIIPVIIILTGGFILFKNQSSRKSEVIDVTPTPTVILPTISDSIVVLLTPKNSNREVMLKISGLESDVASVEYELTYLTGAVLPRGVLGKITPLGKTEITRDDIVLGTCSSGKCVYDQGVTKIDLSLKINSAKGASVFQKSYTL